MNAARSTPRLTRTLAVFAWSVCTLRGAPVALAAPTPATLPVKAVIDASRTAAPINPNLYGMFIEHAGSLVYRGMWAELIDDRKFFNPVAPETTAAAPPPRRGRFGGPPRRWTPIGPAERVTMDTAQAYVGEHSPAIALDASEPRGMTQKGLALVRDKSYTGRIVLAGDPAARVSVSLVWGTAATDRQTVTIDKLNAAYATFPVAFKCPVDSDEGRVEITAVGPGTLRVGAVSLMPDDNVEGWRREVVEVLKSLRSGVYRWPGGNFVSAHDWRDAIGAPDQRPPVFDPVWSAVQSNDVGTDEFMALCRLTNVEPYITVNSGFGDARSAAEYVEYANAPATTPWGAKRAANGHPEPYRVKYWNIGNEMWGSYQYGYMPLAQYTVKHNLFAKAMRKVDPTIVLIASGAMPDTMTGSKEALKLGDKLIPDYLGPADWTGALFQKCLDNMDMISEHFYNYDSHFDLAQAKQVPNDKDEPLVDWMRRPANHIRLKYEEYQEYLARIPALKKKPVPIALDEYAYTFGGNYKVVPAYAWTFHEMFRHSDLYQLATLTFITSTYSAAHGQAVLNPTGMLFKFYRDRFGTIPVEVTGNSPQPRPKDPPGGEQPVVNAGSDTFPLDVAAAWTADRKALTIAIINPTETTQTLSLDIRGAALSGKGTLRRMAPQSLTATVVVGQEPGVHVEEVPVAALPRTPTFAPWSVSIYEFPVKGAAAAEGAPAAPVRVEGGLVQGQAADGLVVYKGLPFAAPPVGDLRWRPPQPAPKWTGVRVADHYAPGCLPSMGDAPPSGASEDCLYLNVWTPAKTPADRLPVLVWIYGGGFNAGATSVPVHDGAKLARRGVVLVSIGYRVGVLGFYAHPDLSAESPHHVSGNYGLLDMVAGLQWIRRNIAAFGGDPKHVTIFGESAGGIAVSMLCASPLAKGLFHGAISQSGGSFGPVSKSPSPGENMRSLADAEVSGVEMATSAGAASIGDLRAMPAEKVIEAGRRQRGMAWPIVDGWVIPGDQYMLYEAGRFNDTPILVGYNSDEGLSFTRVRTAEEYVAGVRARYGPFADRLLEAYPTASDRIPKTARDLARDSAFGWHTWTWARLQSSRGKGKAFLYYFDQHAGHAPGSPEADHGSPHGVDVPYVFENLETTKRPLTDGDRRISDAMAAYWTNFAKRGDPNGAGLPPWPAFSDSKPAVMYFADTPKTGPVPSERSLRVLDGYFAWRRSPESGGVSAPAARRPE